MDDGAIVAVVAVEEQRHKKERRSKPHPFNILLYLKHISQNFGTKFIFLLACNYFFLKGAVYIFLLGVQLPFYKSLGIDGIQYQTFTVIALTPWAMKGLIGTISDSFALGGYHKRYYMIICCSGGFLAVCVLGFLPSEVASDHVWIIPILFLCAMFQIATLDLLIEGKYTEKMRDHPEISSDMVTFVWACITVGSLIASAIVGPITDYLGPKVIFWICIPLTLLLLPLLSLGFLPEEKVPPEFRNRLQRRKIKEKGPMFMVAVTTAIGALLLAICGLLCSNKIQSFYSVIASIVMIVLAYYAMPRHLADCNLYMYLQECLYISLAGALDFWYTADPITCVPGGPGFDYTYYQTYSQLVGHSASILGLWIFQIAMSRWKFRHVYWVTTFLRTLASFFDLILVKRWNLALGIGDKWMYLLGDAIVMPITGMLNFMPGVLLTAKLCPHSMEATVYAILAGFSNFGSNTARSIGSYMQSVAGIETQEPDCNFDNLPFLIIFCHCLLPLISIPLTFVLLPDSGMEDPLPEQHMVNSTSDDEGSTDLSKVLSSNRSGRNWRENFSGLWSGKTTIQHNKIPMSSNKVSLLPSKEESTGVNLAGRSTESISSDSENCSVENDYGSITRSGYYPVSLRNNHDHQIHSKQERLGSNRKTSSFNSSVMLPSTESPSLSLSPQSVTVSQTIGDNEPTNDAVSNHVVTAEDVPFSPCTPPIDLNPSTSSRPLSPMERHTTIVPRLSPPQSTGPRSPNVSTNESNEEKIL